MSRDEMAASILAGLVSNPSIIQPCSQSGWALVNCTNEHLARFAIELADCIRNAGLAADLDAAMRQEAGDE